MITTDPKIPSDIAKLCTQVCTKYLNEAHSQAVMTQMEHDLNAKLQPQGWKVHIIQWFAEEANLAIKLEPPACYVNIDITFIQSS